MANIPDEILCQTHTDIKAQLQTKPPTTNTCT